MVKQVALVASVLLTTSVNAQNYDKKKLNWYNGEKYGMATDKAYKKLLKGKKSTPVVVAVIDSGVDIEHEDLKGSIWVNQDEIPDNGIDDDKNGYVDDVHGWNFLGNSKGEEIQYEQLEVTRLNAKYEPLFARKKESEIPQKYKGDYATYLRAKEEFEEEKGKLATSIPRIKAMYAEVVAAEKAVKEQLGKEDYTLKELRRLIKKEQVIEDARLLVIFAQQERGVEKMKKYIDYLESKENYYYNLDYNAREVVGDDPADFEDTDYGNPKVEGPDAMHGTHCAGIIGATRGNGKGNDGVANNVLLMSIRTVPDGDERDKDVALAIRYAVDNGASVVNMSFGKSYSPYQEEVIAAVRHAEEKGVLLVHAAGNDHKNLGEYANFPSPQYASMDSEFTNWIEVGASTRYKNELAAPFSNYSDQLVDIFAPGLEIYSTVPEDKYKESQGTSMAAPMVTGLAALLKSYFPQLTMLEVRDIILQSGKDVSEVLTPLPDGGNPKKVPFSQLCQTGKIANAYNAVKLALEKAN